MGLNVPLAYLRKLLASRFGRQFALSRVIDHRRIMSIDFHWLRERFQIISNLKANLLQRSLAVESARRLMMH